MHIHTHTHTQGGSLKLFRDNLRHTDTHTPWSELCEDNGGSSVINSSITLVSALHLLTASVLQQRGGTGVMLRGLQWSVMLTCSVCVCVCVWGFPLHWVYTSICLLPISVCHRHKTGSTLWPLSANCAQNVIDMQNKKLFLHEIQNNTKINNFCVGSSCLFTTFRLCVCFFWVTWWI